MKTRMTEKHLRRFYRLLSVRMIDFDCGALCAPKNDGIPYCCENEYVVPILFRDEFNWHRNNGNFWKRMPPINRTIRKFIDETVSYYVFSKCPGPGNCLRTKRSINCMTFPFEPHVGNEGEIKGLAYADSTEVKCPLIGRPEKIYNPVYISNSIKFWNELFTLYPEEQDMYMHESRKRERRFKRQGRRLRVFNAK